MSTTGDMVTIHEAAEMLSMPYDALYNEVWCRNLRAYKLGRASWRIQVSDVMAYASGARRFEFEQGDSPGVGPTLNDVTEPNDYLTVPEVAAEIRSSDEFVLRELRRRNLRGSKLGAGWRIHRRDLVKYVDARANVSRVRGHRDY